VTATAAIAVERSSLAAPSIEVAPLLLNKVLRVGTCSGRIVEVEAYGGADDEASHAHRGRTQRNSSMFEQAGTLYVYFTYGMHHCANVVTGDVGGGEAVLIRGLEPIDGVDAMRPRRLAARTDVYLCNGPAKLCEALELTLDHDGVDVVDSGGAITVLDDGIAPPARPRRTPRIGITKAIDRPWRFVVPGSPFASRRES
jgi:DNA-3-methyladenine glycosylase